MCEKNVINVKLMAGSNLISALNAQRAPHGGRRGMGGVAVMTTGCHQDCPVEKKAPAGAAI